MELFSLTSVGYWLTAYEVNPAPGMDIDYDGRAIPFLNEKLTETGTIILGSGWEEL